MAKRKAARAYLLVGPSLLLLAFPARAEDELAARAGAVLKAHCARCHGTLGSAKGGFDYVLQPDLLLARRRLVPGKAAESELYERTRAGEMPPAKEKTRPSALELSILERWIDAGAADWRPASGPRPLVSERDLLKAMRGDLEARPAQQRRFFRYLSLANLANAGRSDQDLTAARLALAKLLNSLSWHSRLTAPVPLDSSGTILRIDLRDYQWTARLWEKLAAAYPYKFLSSSADARRCYELTGTELPHVRADWFIATASRPPLYYDLLALPSADKALERLLFVEAATHIEELSVARAGFNGSGVSKNNRLIERHDAGFGAYWKTYDFSANTERQNLFDRPLGPPPARNSFVHAGGEMIFHLPNGLLGFYLANANGQRIERAPVDVVSDPQRPDRTVEAGLSCFSCHVGGLVPKADQVRAHVLKNARAFAQEDLETVRAIYPPEATLRRLIALDNQRYSEALAKIGLPTTPPANGGDMAERAEPITAASLRYEAVLDLPTAAAEVGLPAERFAERLTHSVELSRILGALLARAGTVQRQAFVAAFADLAKEFRLGDEPAPELSADGAFTGHTDSILTLVFSPDGQLALSGSSDRTLRLWDVTTGKELRRFLGHRESVAAAAFAPDGKRVASGSHDRTLRLWEVTTGKELGRFLGHTDKVTAAAFAPDGRRLLSAGHDGVLRLWDLQSGQELASFSGHVGPVSSVAFARDGRHAVSGGHDRSVRVWDLASREAIRVLDGHTGEVFSVAFAPDGRSVAAGGNDKMVRLWETETGIEFRRLQGHANAVIRVAFSPDGRHLLSGSSQYRNPDRTIRIWDVTTGNELKQFGFDRDRISNVAFSPDGTRALTDGGQTVLRLWNLR